LTHGAGITKRIGTVQ